MTRGSGQQAKVQSIFCTLSSLFFVLCVLAQAQEPTKIPRIGFQGAVSLSAVSPRTQAPGQVCANWGMSKEKTSSSSGDMKRGD